MAFAWFFDPAMPRFAQQQVDVLGHSYLPIDGHLKNIGIRSTQMGKRVVASGFVEGRLPPATTEGDEVGVFGFVETVQVSGHGGRAQFEIGWSVMREP